MYYKSFIPFLVLIFGYYGQSFAAAALDTSKVEDLTHDLLVYDVSFKTFVPAIGQKSTAISIYKDFSGEMDYFLHFKANPGLALFADYRLVYQNSTKDIKTAFIPISGLPKADGSKTLITFYNADKNVPQEVQISHFNEQSSHKKEGVIFNVRKIENTSGLFILFIIILALFSFLKNRYPKKLLHFLGIVKVAGLEENNSYVDYFKYSSFWFVLLNSLSICYIYSLLESSLSESFVFSYLWFGLVFVIFFMFYLKYFFLLLLGKIFSLTNFAKVHFTEILKITFIINIVLVPALTLIQFSEFLDWSISYMLVLTIVLCALIFVLFKLILLTFRVPDFKYIYIFSYLCLAEVIPLGFALKITLF